MAFSGYYEACLYAVLDGASLSRLFRLHYTTLSRPSELDLFDTIVLTMPYHLLAHTAISSNQQNAMAGALRNYLFHGYRRIMYNVPYFAIPIGAGEFETARRPIAACTR